MTTQPIAGIEKYLSNLLLPDSLMAFCSLKQTSTSYMIDVTQVRSSHGSLLQSLIQKLMLKVQHYDISKNVPMTNTIIVLLF